MSLARIFSLPMIPALFPSLPRRAPTCQSVAKLNDCFCYCPFYCRLGRRVGSLSLSLSRPHFEPCRQLTISAVKFVVADNACVVVRGVCSIAQHIGSGWVRIASGLARSAASPSSLSSPNPSVAASVTAPRTNVRAASVPLQQENDEAEENKKRRNVSVRPLTPQTMQQFYLTRLPIPSHLPQLHPGR